MKLIYNSKKEEIACCFFRSTVHKPNIKVLLQITERCNMRCKHCFVSSLSEGNDLSFETIKEQILPKLKEANVTRVTLTGGEPMVHRNIMDIIKLFNENKIHITLCTNALGLNEEKIIEISKLICYKWFAIFGKVLKRRYVWIIWLEKIAIMAFKQKKSLV